VLGKGPAFVTLTPEVNVETAPVEVNADAAPAEVIALMAVVVTAWRNASSLLN
jgi:hypothetical protein